MYIPPDILKRDDLTRMDMRVYGVIRDLIKTRGSGSPILETIATAVGGGTRTVTRSVAALEAADLLVVERQPGVKQTYALPKQAKAKTKWLDAGEVMANLQDISDHLDRIYAMAQRNPTVTCNSAIRQAAQAIRELLLRRKVRRAKTA